MVEGNLARESSLDSSLTTILFEVTMKLASLCDSKFFLLAQGSSDRIFAGERELCDAYVEGRLLPRAKGKGRETELNLERVIGRGKGDGDDGGRRREGDDTRSRSGGRQGGVVRRRLTRSMLRSDNDDDHDNAESEDDTTRGDKDHHHRRHTPSTASSDRRARKRVEPSSPSSPLAAGNLRACKKARISQVEKSGNGASFLPPVEVAPAWRIGNDRDDDRGSDDSPREVSVRKAIENGDRAASSSTSPNDAEDDDEEEISPFSGFTMSSLGFGRHPASARDGAATSLLNENGQPGPYPRPIGGTKFPSAPSSSSRPFPDSFPSLRPSSALSDLFDRFQPPTRQEYHHQAVKTELDADDHEEKADASSANDQILSLESSGRALVLSSRGLERVEMNSDVVKEFFDNHDNVNKEKLRALQIIAPDKLFVKGTSEYRLLTSTMSEMGRTIAQFCKNRGIETPKDPSAKMLMNSLFDAWIRSSLPHLYETQVRPCEGRTAMGFLRHLTRVTFYCCFKKPKSFNSAGAGQQKDESFEA